MDLVEGATAFDLVLTEQQSAQFARYQSLLQEWNQRMNLTGISDPLEIQVRHFLDGLSCATATGDLNGQRLIDVGTGAGFPGLPLKILYPDLSLTLVESVTKKTRFLEAVVAELGLKEVTILDERAETLGQQVEHRGKYHWAVARAVARLPVLLEYLLPFCRVGGHVLAQKGDTAQTEAADASHALKVLGGGRPTFYPVQLPGREEVHYLVVIEKVAKTPKQYPRQPGRPAKQPL